MTVIESSSIDLVPIRDRAALDGELFGIDSTGSGRIKRIAFFDDFVKNKVLKVQASTSITVDFTPDYSRDALDGELFGIDSTGRGRILRVVFIQRKTSSDLDIIKEAAAAAFAGRKVQLLDELSSHVLIQWGKVEGPAEEYSITANTLALVRWAKHMFRHELTNLRFSS